VLIRWAYFALCGGLIALGGCASSRMNAQLNSAGGNAALFGQFQAYNGASGEPIEFEQVVSRAAAADAVLFGEEHSNSVCNALEAQMLAALARRGRPMTLAMEFFETDTQPPLDRYLAGDLAESEFREKTGQKNAYLLAHRPLIEMCKSAGIPVMAANAPRRFVRGLRTSGKTYAEYVASLDPTDRALLPATSTAEKNAYWDRFIKVMEDHGDSGAPSSQPASAPASAPAIDSAVADDLLYRGYMSQCLWDDAMAEFVARHREANPRRRVMLVVGSFHVSYDGGTKGKLAARRPGDRLFTIVFRGTSDTALPFDADDRNAGDVVVYGVTPPEKKSE
jgi:uncharacterized iron-regulated protein